MLKAKDKSDMAQDKAMIRKGIGQHEAAKHKGSPKTALKLKHGGPTGQDRERMGRGMSRAANQERGKKHG